jgi:hypothetical protein
MFDLKGKHEHVFLSILNKYIYALIRSSTEHKLFMYLTSSIIIKDTNTKYFATAAASAGVDDRLFKKHGRWKSDSAKDGYVKESISNRITLSKQLGL